MSVSQGIFAAKELEALLMSDLNYHYNIGCIVLTKASRKFLANKTSLDPSSLRQFKQNQFGDWNQV